MSASVAHAVLHLSMLGETGDIITSVSYARTYYEI